MAVRDPRRSAYLAFVREHHPDRGGDPDVFAAGLAEFAERARYDAPVVVTARRGPFGRWWLRRRRRRARRVL